MMQTDSDKNGADNHTKSTLSAKSGETKVDNNELSLEIVKQIESNYKTNQQIFAKVLRGFQRSYYSRLIGYWSLLVLAIGSLLTTTLIVTSYGLLRIVIVLVVVNIIAFVAFYSFQKTQSIEKALFYMMWLNIIHSGYTSSLLWLTNSEDALPALTQATEQASQQLQALLDHYAQSTSKHLSVHQSLQNLKNY